jgi:hypothetical protein
MPTSTKERHYSMIDPISALAIASSAVGQIKSLLSAGRDASNALSSFAGALSDINYSAEKAKDPPFYKSFSSSYEKEAANAFIAKQKVDALKKDLEVMIMYTYGMQGLEDYKKTIRTMKAQREKHEYRKKEMIDAMISWGVGFLILAVTVAFAGYGLYLLGQNQGKW